MKKTVKYTVRTSTNAITGEVQTVPVVVDRREPADLADIVAECIDRNLILGAKPTAAAGIAEGIAEQLAMEFKRGNGVKFGSYFYGRLYLNGTTNQNGDLGEGNGLNVRLYKGDGFKLGLGDFSFSFANGGDLPDVEFCIGRGDGVKSELVPGNDLVVYGTNLWDEGDTSVKVRLVKDGGAVAVGGDAIATKSAEMLVVKATALAGLSNGRWTVSVERTTSEGRTLYGKGANIQCLGFGPAPGPTPIAETSDGKCKVMSFRDGASAAEFTLGHPWKIGGVGLYGENAPEGEWALAQATAEVDGTTVEFTVTFSEDGTEATFGSHMFDPSAGTYENVALRYPVTRGGETETLEINIPRLVVE